MTRRLPGGRSGSLVPRTGRRSRRCRAGSRCAAPCRCACLFPEVTSDDGTHGLPAHGGHPLRGPPARPGVHRDRRGPRPGAGGRRGPQDGDPRHAGEARGGGVAQRRATRHGPGSRAAGRSRGPARRGGGAHARLRRIRAGSVAPGGAAARDRHDRRRDREGSRPGDLRGGPADPSRCGSRPPSCSPCSRSGSPRSPRSGTRGAPRPAVRAPRLLWASGRRR